MPYCAASSTCHPVDDPKLAPTFAQILAGDDCWGPICLTSSFPDALRNNILPFFPPEQVFVIALEDRSGSEYHETLVGDKEAGPVLSWQRQLVPFLIGYQDAAKISETRNTFHEQHPGRRNMKSRTKYNESVDICADGHVDRLQAIAAEWREGLLELEQTFKRRWAHFPTSTIMRYGREDYCKK